MCRELQAQVLPLLLEGREHGAEEGAAWFEQIAQIKVMQESLLLPRLRRRLLRPLNP